MKGGMLLASFYSPMALGSVCARGISVVESNTKKAREQERPGPTFGRVANGPLAVCSVILRTLNTNNLTSSIMPVQHLSQVGYDRHQAAMTQGPKVPQDQESGHIPAKLPVGQNLRAAASQAVARNTQKYE